MKREPLTDNAVFSDPDYAGHYARNHHQMSEKFGRQYAQKLEKRGIVSGQILDAGCGSGGTCTMLASMIAEIEVIGIDLSQPLLDIARKHALQAGLSERVKFEEGDVTQLPFGDDSFVAVLNINMLHLIEEPVRMLDEIERVLKPEGAVYIADLKRSWLGVFENEMKSALTLKEARQVFEKSGLRKGKFSSGLIFWQFES